MADILVKINIKNADCRNIYFVNNDNLFGGKEITKAPTYLSRDFKLVLRITSINISGIRIIAILTVLGLLALLTMIILYM